MSRKMLIDGEADGQSRNFDYDLFVIGAGSGGVRAARFSANAGAKVGICELPFHPISSDVIGGVGGTCVIRGCVPKKILVYGASYGGELEDAKKYGWELNDQINFNWKTLLQKKTEEINRLSGIYKRLLSNAGVKLFEGEGKVAGPNDVEVTQIDGTKLSFSAKHILIATGSRAQFPNIPGKELGISSDEALSLEDLPKRAVILGGGYIAVEFASIWRGMGVEVHLCFRKELPLRSNIGCCRFLPFLKFSNSKENIEHVCVIFYSSSCNQKNEATLAKHPTMGSKKCSLKSCLSKISRLLN